mmetsp:Transcript_27006/g.59059  ORF Transcript_27006/g.59059 Transcript_27006/m.59059 type:complete len:279 (+) Transcript_27006:155-991(+)
MLQLLRPNGLSSAFVPTVSAGILLQDGLNCKAFLHGLPRNRSEDAENWFELDEHKQSLAPNLPPGLPAPVDWEVKQAVFVKSSSDVADLPSPIGPEFAFIGHSNVGKSSIVNLLTLNPNLAKCSKKPGRTKTINHYLINRKWLMVDCPGYGDAIASREQRLAWHEFTKEYFLSRRTLAHIFLLIDASRDPSPIDFDAAVWLAQDSHRPWSIIYTKLDCRVGIQHPLDNMHYFNNMVDELTRVKPAYVPTSARKGIGREALLKYISSLRQQFRMPLVFK